jgi:hypothetical protein
MSKEPPLTEVEIAEIGQIFFEQRGWELFPEVVLKGFNGRPDFVAKKHQLCSVIECKKTLSYPVIEQLTRWRHDRDERIENEFCNKPISSIPHLLIAFTGGNNKPLALLKKEILRQHRIGFYEVTRVSMDDKYASFVSRDKQSLGKFKEHGFDTAYCQWKNYRWKVKEVVPPKIQEGSRKTAHKILSQLNNDMKQATAGANGQEGNYMTPFKRTMNAVDTILKRGGEYHIVDIMNALHEDFGGHHYSSDRTARNSIPKFIVQLEIGTQVSDAPAKYQAI